MTGASGARTPQRASDWTCRYANLREDLHRWGLRRAIYMRIMGRLAPFLNVSYANTRELLPRELRQTRAGCSIRIASREELLRASANPALQMSAAFIDDALARGDICCAAFDGDDMVAYVWRAFVATRHVEGIWVCFRAPFRYGYKALTLPAWRGRRLLEALGPVADQLCRERGRTMGIGFVSTHNYPSLAASKRYGDRRIGVIGYVRVAGRLFTFRSPGARKVGFGFSRTPTAS
jgi:hypothetical protein